jgi:2-polyprenyl-3-methyl-5-hydroxy-6-metoxy-1,4-benzoquinol methylase
VVPWLCRGPCRIRKANDERRRGNLGLGLRSHQIAGGVQRIAMLNRSQIAIESLEASTGIEVVPCPSCLLCREPGPAQYVDTVDWLFGVLGNWNIRYCKRCDFAWLDPQPVPHDVGKLYSRYYTHVGKIPVTRLDRLRKAMVECAVANLGYAVDRPKRILPRLLSRVRPLARAAALQVLGLPASDIGKLLDVGCGNGEFIDRMRSLGWSVSGVDPDPKAVSHARSRGLEVFNGMVSDIPANNQFDVITLNHVIEHAIDPVALLRDCRNRLRPDTGRLIVATPNLSSLGHWWFKGCWRGLEVPRHLVLFSMASLRECARQAGLSVQRLDTETRLARMIYTTSVYAQRGYRDVGQRVDFRVKTKIAACLFQAVEDTAVYLNKDVGEEVFCVCWAPRKRL